jgi:hypothetical protein
MRVLFYRQGDASFLNSSGVKYSGGVAANSSSVLIDHVAVNNLTGNKGNMIHREAMPKLLSYDRQSSAYVNLLRLRDDCANIDEYAEIVNNNFDCVILSMANFIQPGEQEPRLYELLSCLTIELYVVGVGLQIPKPISEMAESTQKLLRHFDSCAKLFAVRGKRTEAWAHKNGLKNAIALGCPSMFVYPRNLYNVKAPSFSENSKIISAGHIHQSFFSKTKKGRALALMSALEGRNVDYVFQSELFTFKDITSMEGVFDEATSRISTDVVNAFIKQKTSKLPPFKRYFQFDSPAAWRQASSNYDIYVGDRIHGAVAALQSGVPALIIYDDIRVKELASYFHLPAASVQELEEIGLDSLVEDRVNEDCLILFRERYRKVLSKFVRVLNSAGLQLVNTKDIKSVLGAKFELNQ